MVTQGREGGFQDWAELRAHAIERFNGETPNPIAEQEIIGAYELHPDAVQRAIEQTAADLTAGTIRSGWGILRHRADAIRNPPSNPKAQTGRQAEKQQARAEQWIRNAGFHYPGWGACQDALLEDLHLPTHLAALLEPLYDDTHPQSAKIEADANTRARAWKVSQQKLLELAKQKRAELEAAQTRPRPTVDTSEFA